MAETLLRQRPGNGAVGGAGRGPGGNGGGSGAGVAPVDAGRLGLWLLLAAVTMLFASFTSTLLMRRAAPDWTPIPLPGILWVNTAALLASSAALEWGRRRVRVGDVAGLRLGLLAASVLGAGFVAGQMVAWRQLAAMGVFLRTNPHSSFFYLLTGAHGLHLVVGVLVLLYVLARALLGRYSAQAYGGVGLAATYWHFMDGLWLYLFLLLFAI
ncbi:MAG: cytochrome c oxidase subunit 3 [Armatimonadetes bacterium]|nr:cytochrome c oxidase subunit 3 [Armatimonadota bacterium]